MGKLVNLNYSDGMAKSLLSNYRTKRLRPQSPIPFAITANSSSGGDKGENSSNYNNINTDEENIVSSPTSSAELFHDSTEEEEDMANCLILLAQGQSRFHQETKQNQEGGNGGYKFNSKRYLETTTATGTTKVGYYVYECKTCNRTFPSFQALGGHRASHKKLKVSTASAMEDRRNLVLSSEEDEDGQFFKNQTKTPVLTLELNTRGLSNITNKVKIHECSICGSQFTSGQALGGHMRRHRSPLSNNTTLALIPMALECDEEAKRSPSSSSPQRNNGFSLDLNLPAPEEESKFGFASKQQQKQQPQESPLVFSAAPTLVDCHY
ncbi:hypothetical protein RJ641_036349 [Dillenia turbinata]|uniref:C2H2-type domain-containing protein n=1 Tax=Dillenia turbinata TaxID=194707 RepID=A0AAN8VG47_9MAGN